MQHTLVRGYNLQHRPRFVLLFTGARAFAELGPAVLDEAGGFAVSMMQRWVRENGL